ncbi:sentrin-specific protease 7-like isoform X1 [Lates japonicus]|uniref:Sentrin-specific protease 7-like isoform X1 n=1 Tax=Lates japonicus TaxID=270547 RepID=A0AAD3NQE4_LATJO|nr:sentrin-specific protease 7-like isoform X1 [Lates japonicus]
MSPLKYRRRNSLTHLHLQSLLSCPEPAHNLRDVVKLLGLNSLDRGGASAANHRSPGSWRSQSQAGERGVALGLKWFKWRPKRAHQTAKLRPRGDLRVPVSAWLHGEVHAGSPLTPERGTWRRVELMETRFQTTEEGKEAESTGRRIKASSHLNEDVREQETEVRSSERGHLNPAALPIKRPRQSPAEPQIASPSSVVLSSEEEEEGDGAKRDAPQQTG